MIKRPQKKKIPIEPVYCNQSIVDDEYENGYNQALEDCEAYHDELLKDLKGHYEGCQSLFKGGYVMNIPESIMYEPVNNLAKELRWDNE